VHFNENVIAVTSGATRRILRPREKYQFVRDKRAREGLFAFWRFAITTTAGRIFSPYYELRKKVITCPECTWQGLGAYLKVSEVFEESCIIEYVCPQCSFEIAFTQGPTVKDSRANWDHVSEADRLVVWTLERERRRAEL
jgi:hypothetical protein